MFTTAIHPAMGSKNGIRNNLSQDKSLVQIHIATMQYSERPAPTLRVKKMPPKKAGPKSGRTFNICWFGITRYPASLIDVILLCRLTLDRYTCIVAIAWAASIPRKSALAVQENLFVNKFFWISAIYLNNMLPESCMKINEKLF